MTQEEKNLLLQDLCARLPYNIICHIEIPHSFIGFVEKGDLALNSITNDTLKCDFKSCWGIELEFIKPYLRPMSSMTGEERIEFSKLLVKRYCEEDWEGHISTSYCIEIDNVYTDDENGIKYPSVFSMDAIDWFNKKMFDYRGLISMGLALEAPDGMYNKH